MTKRQKLTINECAVLWHNWHPKLWDFWLLKCYCRKQKYWFFQADHTIMSWCIFSGMYKYCLKFGAYEFYDPVHADSLHSWLTRLQLHYTYSVRCYGVCLCLQQAFSRSTCWWHVTTQPERGAWPNWWESLRQRRNAQSSSWSVGRIWLVTGRCPTKYQVCTGISGSRTVFWI